MLYAEGSATSEYKIFVAEVIAHEFVHLWFGDYVTLDWWSSGWLKEGFAEFLEHYVLERVMKTEGSSWYPLSRIGVEDVFDGMRDDALEHTEPLTDNTVATQDQISEHMGLYTYTKGMELAHACSDTAFVFGKATNPFLFRGQVPASTSCSWVSSVRTRTALASTTT